MSSNGNWTQGAEGVTEPDRPSYRLPKARRLLKRSEFNRVRQVRQQVGDQVLRIGFRERQDGGPSRLGLTVGRRLGNAVARNRIKRVLRNAWRQQPGLFPRGLDLVVIPVSRESARSTTEVTRSLRRLAARIRERGRERP